MVRIVHDDLFDGELLVSDAIASFVDLAESTLTESYALALRVTLEFQLQISRYDRSLIRES